MSRNEDAVAIITSNSKSFSQSENEEYIKLWGKSIKRRVEEATGFSDVEIESIDVHIESFLPAISYTISGDYELAVVHGQAISSPQHIVVANERELSLRAAEQINSDMNNANLRSSIEEALVSNRYGSITEKIGVYDNLVALLRSYPCGECGGRGSTKCTSCGGHGNVRCFKCKGSGQIRCGWCNGTGRKQPYNSSLPSYHERCTYCHGTGVQTCNICEGRGYELCSNCEGHGEVRCSHCVGTGWLTSILHTNLTATPEYSFEYLKTASQEFMRVIKKIGISNISDYGKIKLYDSYRSSDGAFIIRYVCHLPIAEAEVKIRGKKSTWLICGYNACVIDAGGAMDNIMEDVISAMQKSEPSLLRPYADVSSSIADFMSYDVNETILSESIEN